MLDIRQCTMADLPYLYEICYLTGNNGNTVEGICPDKFKIGHYFAAPYLYFDREMCFVLTEKNIPKGYIVGTHNTEKYTEWLNREWLPDLRNLYDFKENEDTHDLEAFLNSVIKDDTFIDERLEPFEAHLHIDLLPELQGKGMGRTLINTFFDQCRKRGSKKVHLGVSKENPRAVAFYKKMGMYEIYDVEGAYMMGFDL